MTVLRQAKGQYVFRLSAREKGLLLNVLALYPRIPSGHHRLSKADGLDKSNQKLLDDALAEQRAENKQRLQALLSEPKRFVQQHAGWSLSLSSVELEWLLQVLNDIRVGSWVILGSPETRLDAITEKTAPDVWAMEMAGSFQMAFLAALETKG